MNKNKRIEIIPSKISWFLLHLFIIEPIAGFTIYSFIVVIQRKLGFIDWLGLLMIFYIPVLSVYVLSWVAPFNIYHIVNYDEYIEKHFFKKITVYCYSKCYKINSWYSRGRMIILFYFEKEGKNLQYYASECMVSEDSFKESRIISRIIELNQAVEINGPAVKYDIRINKNAN